MKAWMSAPSAFLPDETITSLEIENLLSPLYDRLGLIKGRLEKLTGVQARGVWPAGTKSSDLVSKACEGLNGDFSKSDLIIHASVCKDQLEPATSVRVHKLLNLPSRCEAFDISNACLGVMSALSLAKSLVELGQKEQVLIVAGENSGPLIYQTLKKLNQDGSINRKSLKPYLANLTIGSAAVAFWVSKDPIGNNSFLLGEFVTMTDSAANDLCQGSGDRYELAMETQSEKLLEAGLSLAYENFQQFSKDLDLKSMINHQVGSAHQQQMTQKLGLKNLSSYETFSRWGNTGSAAIHLTLYEALRNNISLPRPLALLGIGSGLTSTMGVLL